MAPPVLPSPATRRFHRRRRGGVPARLRRLRAISLRLPAQDLRAPMEPYWTIRTRSVPFWMVFNTEGSFQALDRYLGRAPTFDELLITLFSHGVDSIGLVPISEWRRLFSRVRQRGDFIGVDEVAFPRDFGVFVRYHFDFQRKISARHPSPPVLTLKELNEFLSQGRERYRAAWLDRI